MKNAQPTNKMEGRAKTVPIWTGRGHPCSICDRAVGRYREAPFTNAFPPPTRILQPGMAQRLLCFCPIPTGNSTKRIMNVQHPEATVSNDSTVDKVKGYADAAMQGVSDSVEKVGKQFGDSYRRAEEKMGEVSERAERVVSEHPGTSALTAFAVGCGVGLAATLLLMPRRRPAYRSYLPEWMSSAHLREVLDSILPDAVARPIHKS